MGFRLRVASRKEKESYQSHDVARVKNVQRCPMKLRDLASTAALTEQLSCNELATRASNCCILAETGAQKYPLSKSAVIVSV